MLLKKKSIYLRRDVVIIIYLLGFYCYFMWFSINLSLTLIRMFCLYILYIYMGQMLK